MAVSINPIIGPRIQNQRVKIRRKPLIEGAALVFGVDTLQRRQMMRNDDRLSIY